MSFVHLHTHSHYSLLDGLGSINNLVQEAKRHKMPALALTDHGVLYGLVEFYQACLKQEIKPILGVEAYLTDGSLTDRERTAKPYHLVLLAMNYTGYRNLLKLTSIAHLEGFYYKPRFNWETLAKYSEGLIALTGCLNGPIARPIAQNNPTEAAKNLQQLIDIFGAGRLYLEMQHRPSIPDQLKVNNALKKLSTDYKIPLVVTNDVHYVATDDATAHDVLICLQTKTHLTDKNRMSYLGENYSLLPASYFEKVFSDTPEALTNTLAIAERCNVEIPLGKINLPYYEKPDGVAGDDLLRSLAIAGIPRRYGIPFEKASDEIKKRLEYELDVIQRTGFADYFLIVQDFVNWAKEQGIMVGPGRGSAAGSIVSYLIGITNIDPIAYNLLFERFLNPERISMPDIDMDFADTERNRVLEYVEKKYGKDRVAQIVTFGTMAARAAVRDVGRAMNLSYGFCDRIAKLIPPFTPLAEAIKKVEELKGAYDSDEDARRLLDMAQKLEGVARHTSTHACAVIITRDPLTDHVPLQYSSSDPDIIISQYSMHPVEDLGLLKMDFLGLTNLTILQTTVEIIEKTAGVSIDLETIPLDNPETFKLLQRGETTGIFQLESGGMTRYLKKLKPTDIEDIIAMVSLYRPGPMEFIEDYIAGKHGTRTVEYLHPKLAPILDKTYGIAVYQEQVLQIARDLAGFSYGEADILRKAVGKKIKKLLVEQEEKMIAGMVARSIESKTAKKIWEFILPFARYGFNRSHAASYALIAYQTAYLKSHYPAQFMAALMTADQGNTERIARQIRECQKMGLIVRPPDVNESFSTFSVVMDETIQRATNNIHFGLGAIKNVGEHIARTIIKNRKEHGRYVSLEDFLRRITDKDLNKKSLESLIKCGALDSLGDRSILLGNLDNLLIFNKKVQGEASRKQNNLFADLPLKKSFDSIKLDSVPPLSMMDKLTYEKDLLGLYITDHPFKEYVGLVPASVALGDMDRAQKKSEGLVVSGVITAIKKIVTRNGKPMYFVTLEDSTGSVELVVFPRLVEQYPDVWHEHTSVIIHGTMSEKEGMPKILADRAEILTPDKIKELQGAIGLRHKLWLTMPAEFTKDDMQNLKKLLDKFPGKTPVYIVINNGVERKVKTPMTVTVSPDLADQLKKIIGEENVALKSV